MDIEEWKIHVLIEVGGGVVSNVLEYSSPGEVATRLEAIAKDLRQHYGDEPQLPPSSRPEINQLSTNYSAQGEF